MDGFDDGDSTCDSGFEMDGGIELSGKRKEFDAAFGEEGFIASDDGFSCFESGGDDVEGVGSATDEFDDDMDVGVMDEVGPSGGERISRDGGVGAGMFSRIAYEDFFDMEGDVAIGAIGDKRTISSECMVDTRTDGSESCEANSE